MLHTSPDAQNLPSAHDAAERITFTLVCKRGQTTSMTEFCVADDAHSVYVQRTEFEPRGYPRTTLCANMTKCEARKFFVDMLAHGWTFEQAYRFTRNGGCERVESFQVERRAGFKLVVSWADQADSEAFLAAGEVEGAKEEARNIREVLLSKLPNFKACALRRAVIETIVYFSAGRA